MSEVRRAGRHVWRPSLGWRVTWLVICVGMVAGTTWLALDGGLSVKDKIIFSVADVIFVVTLPVVLFRWRMVLQGDELVLVFLRTRRLPIRNIVEAKTVPREGLTFVCKDGRTDSFGALANSAWGHRLKKPTRADLAARTVLVAAAQARGEVPPIDYRLPPMQGLKKAIVEGGIWAAIVGLVLGG